MGIIMNKMNFEKLKEVKNGMKNIQKNMVKCLEKVQMKTYIEIL